MLANKRLAQLCYALLLLNFSFTALAQTSPHLKYNNGYGELIVNNKPFIMLGGELGNSSASSMAYMASAWPKFKSMNLNTIVTPAYWDLIEPQEGKFDFKLIDGIIADARKNQIKLVFLWFGTWKNGMTCYAPAWVKTDTKRFPRAESSTGDPQEIVSPFSMNALTADKKAFSALMKHVKAIDSKQQTVVLVQVENEIGVLPEARDHSKPANDAFSQPVPEAFMTYLTAHQNTLVPDVKKRWQDNGAKTAGTWEEVFGKSRVTDQLFMAWYFAKYTNEVAKAGKVAYNLPMYVNAALIKPEADRGGFPSGGPVAQLLDPWKAATPNVDFISPDFYNPDFKYWNDLYTRPDNLLFIPEHKFEDGVDAKVFYAIGHYQALGFSPFSIESTLKASKEPLGKAYDIIGQMAGEISKAKQRGTIDGALLSRENGTATIEMGDYILTVAHELRMGWSAKAKDKTWPLTGAIVLGLSNNEYYVVGTGVTVTFKPKAPGLHAGILQIDEGKMVNGKWTPRRRMNGDQDHQGRLSRIAEGSYDIQRIKLYNY